MISFLLSSRTFSRRDLAPDKDVFSFNNEELAGGAKYTKMKKGDGLWEYYGFILGLEKRVALSIEKKVHIYSIKTSGKNPLEKRINCINNILKDYPDLTFIIL
jgi:hypothetical protein